MTQVCRGSFFGALGSMGIQRLGRAALVVLGMLSVQCRQRELCWLWHAVLSTIVAELLDQSCASGLRCGQRSPGNAKKEYADVITLLMSYLASRTTKEGFKLGFQALKYAPLGFHYRMHTAFVPK